MRQANVRRLVAATAVTALLATALAAPAMAVPEKEPKAGPKVEQQAKVEAKAIRRAERLARAEARAEAKAARKQARAEAKSARKAARQARAEAKSVCKDGGWTELITAANDAFRNQGQCVKYVVHGGKLGSAETILVVAYSERNDVPGYQADGVDVLISKLLDDNGSGVPDDGDSIVMGRYPKNHAATDFGDWGNKSHSVGFVIGAKPSLSAIAGNGHQYRWLKTADTEAYSEAGGYTSSFYDRLDGRSDSVSTRHGSPSEPDSSLTNNYSSDGDEDFIDVAFYY